MNVNKHILTYHSKLYQISFTNSHSYYVSLLEVYNLMQSVHRKKIPIWFGFYENFHYSKCQWRCIYIVMFAGIFWKFRWNYFWSKVDSEKKLDIIFYKQWVKPHLNAIPSKIHHRQSLQIIFQSLNNITHSLHIITQALHIITKSLHIITYSLRIITQSIHIITYSPNNISQSQSLCIKPSHCTS